MLAVHSVEFDNDSIMEQMQAMLQQMQQDRIEMMQRMETRQQTITNLQAGGGSPWSDGATGWTPRA